jgi:hypothetical protein
MRLTSLTQSGPAEAGLRRLGLRENHLHVSQVAVIQRHAFARTATQRWQKTSPQGTAR